MGIAMAAIYKLENVRQERAKPAKCVSPAEAAQAQDSLPPHPPTVSEQSATVLLFTGVRYERLPGAPLPRRRSRDVLELTD